jgi:hypothetical protein
VVRFWRVSATAALAIAVAGGASIGPAAPAFAAPGDASARGVVIGLNASVASIPVITANATIGTATAPAGGGTDTSTALAVTVPTPVGVTVTGTVVQVTATRGATASSASATVANFGLNVLGTSVLSATAATATVNCPQVGAQTADARLANVVLFGTPVTVLANTPGVTQSAAVTVPGLTGATLTVTLTEVETTSATGATAIALLARVTLNGSVAGIPVTIPVGQVILAEAICERPAAAPATTPPATPTATATARPILPVTGSSSDSTGIMLAVGTALIFAGAVARVAFRRRRSERTATIS